MGWLFAVSIGLQERSRKALLLALPFIALGHEGSVAVMAVIAAVTRSLTASRVVILAVGGVLLAYGLWQLVRARHKSWAGMRLSRWGLARWSFVMSLGARRRAHGAAGDRGAALREPGLDTSFGLLHGLEIGALAAGGALRRHDPHDRHRRGARLRHPRAVGAAPLVGERRQAVGGQPRRRRDRRPADQLTRPSRPRTTRGTSMSVTDELLANNEHYAEQFSGPLPLPPAKGVAVVACMDARLNVYGILGLQEGEAHVIRNAGGVVTDDEIRSLSISQRLLGTTEIILIHHTDCGMLTFTDDGFKADIQAEVGIKPAWSAEAFGDLDADVRQSIARIKASPFIPHTDSVRGFVFDVATGRLREVDADATAA